MYGLWVCQENIERFRRMLAAEPDLRERGILSDLIAREVSRLDQLKSEIRSERRTRALSNLKSRQT